MDNEELITTKELCEWLKIGRTTANRWKNDNGMPYIGMGRTLRYKKSDVLKWLEDQKNKNDK